MFQKNTNLNKAFRKSILSPGFSLAEVIVAMTIGAMVLVTVLGIYGRAEHASAAITQRLESSRFPCEILQRIAEDLDRIISSSSDIKITIENKYENLFPTAKLTITRTIKDSREREQTFEEIVWQSSYDFESADNGLILYRGHSGIVLEDKVLEKNKDDWERELLVPICSGVTFFKIYAIRGKEPIERWNGSPPHGIAITISFAEPFKRVTGTLDVPDEEKITRTIAIDRTRKIKFEIGEQGSNKDENTATDVKSPVDEKLPPTTQKQTEKFKR